ncbi:hypothetical protein BM525_18965 (plasmid) [Alteromonas mediterranea]|uniref:Uncharacterized protein n=1 Tax=Alteromonas mediterranea TaxID=314275 RepID=A0AAC9NSR5_9ALTE|nr:hypothetical protein [Alteromonas mediterranea]APD91965.1 hypothetical protein BM524_18770 [Alteromonas mediterranea]APD99819.1 hypothetical protein BM525_18965 [Alteromonas mediterranea]
MTPLTRTINDIAATLEMNAIDLNKFITTHNELNEQELIETEDELRQALVEVAFSARMCGEGKKRYSAVCKINDAYFKEKLNS